MKVTTNKSYPTSLVYSTYVTWRNMVQRCTNANNIGYHGYGKIGIAVCQRWSDFENFYADMGDKPIGLTLERVDTRLGYSPDNCIWAGYSAQNNNRRDSVRWPYRGELLSIAELAAIAGNSKALIHKRLYSLKWSVEDAVNVPKGGQSGAKVKERQATKLYA